MDESEKVETLEQAQPQRSRKKDIIYSLVLILFFVVIGPVLWLAILILFGLIAGDPFRVFTNPIIWRGEFIGKAGLAMVLSSTAAVVVTVRLLLDLIEVLTFSKKNTK
ncbi:MAG: hypothetical protein ACKVH8_14850 [Pirellulales bacterium]|jgi:hypothetical protein